MPRPDPVVVALAPESLALAHRIAAAIAASVAVRGADFTDTGVHLRALFAAGHPIVGIAAAGILIRCLAPLIAAKDREPPVLAVSEDGAVVVPLLGGHHGGNDLARIVAAALGTDPAITTAGDRLLGLALDAPPDGWRLENPDDAKPVMAALIRDTPAHLSGAADWVAPLIASGRVTATPAPDDAPIVLTARGLPPLVYRRQTLALGLGAIRGADPHAVIGHARRALADAGQSAFAVAGVWSVAAKADEAAVHALARDLGVPARFFPAARLEAETPRLANPSPAVFAEIGAHGVAEAAALAAAGPDGTLVLPKVKSAEATVALARIAPGSNSGLPPGSDPGPPPGSNPGLPRGRLAIVGIGPGAADWRSPEASRLIATSDELVGYGLYLDLLGPLARGKTRTDFPLGGEEDRCRHALEAAGKGRTVALVCSGDGGIYAMGALVMELLDRGHGGVSPAARRVEIVHAPGISALQAASARAGAPLGHDFCTISLSDLLTPRETILRRIRAAAEGDFVIAFYNPVSRRRRTLLDEARAILTRHRPATTPVLLASNLGRPDETLRLRTLDTLRTDEVDMLTLVMVGSTETRLVRSGDISAGVAGHWLYTPRGYAAKAALEVAP